MKHCEKGSVDAENIQNLANRKIAPFDASAHLHTIRLSEARGNVLVEC